MYAVFGLGNPDKEYQNTRHNFGSLVIESLTKDLKLDWNEKAGYYCLRAETTINKHKVRFCRPQTYMNHSGQIVQNLVNYYKIPAKNIIIVYDDIDLPFGEIRVSVNKSSGGHKGIASIIEHLGSSDFNRVRLGIGPQTGKAENFVLKKFSSSQTKKLPEVIDIAKQAIIFLINEGLEKTANKYN